MEPQRRQLAQCALFFSAFMALIMSLWQIQFQQLMTLIIRRRRQLHLLLESEERHLRNNLEMGQQDIYHRMIIAPSRTERRVWQKTRCSYWWDRTVNLEFTDRDWLNTFRMSRRTFDVLCDAVAPYVSPDVGSVREPVPLRKRVAIAVYKLGNNAPYRFVAKKFGVHKSTTSLYIRTFCRAVTKHMLPRFIQLPDVSEAQEIAAWFEEKFRIPQIMGCIDTTHISITPPTCDPAPFINTKLWTSFILQAVTDNKCRFRNISCKSPGSAHEEQVLKESDLYKTSNQLPQCNKELNGVSVPLMFAGSCAQPLCPWLVTAYTNANTGSGTEMVTLNSYLNQVRETAALTLRQLKCRWRILQKRVDVHFTFVPNIIETCCVLHNFVSEHEVFPPHWYIEEEANDRTIHESTPPLVPVDGEVDIVATDIRTALKNYVVDKCKRDSLVIYPPCDVM